MKKYLGYLLLIVGVGVLVGGVFRNEDKWVAYLILVVVIVGISTLLEAYKKEVVDEITKKLEK